MKRGAKRGNYPTLTHDQFHACTINHEGSAAAAAAYEVLVLGKQLTQASAENGATHQAAARKVQRVVDRHKQIRHAYLNEDTDDEF